MPDPNHRNVELAPVVVDLYEGPKGIAVFLRDWFLLLKREPTAPPPDLPELDMTVPAQDVGIPNYTVYADKLNVALSNLRDAHNSVPEQAENSSRNSDNAKAWVEGLISNHNSKISEWPDPGVSLSEHCMNEILAATNEAYEKMPGYEENQEEIADEIDTLTSQLEETRRQLEEARQSEDTSGDGQGSQEGSWDPAGLDDWPSMDGAGTSDGTGSDDDVAPGSETDTQQDGAGVTDGVTEEQDPSDYGSTPDDFETDTPDPATPVDDGAYSGYDPMAGMMSSLPWQLASMMGNGMTNPYAQDPAAQTDANDPREVIAAPPPIAPAPPTSTAPPAPPAAAGAAPPPSQPAVAPGGPSAQPAANGTPPRTPGADGTVDYTFPDGKVQKVSAVVAQGLDAAFANTDGTDAQTAYAATPAKWTDRKQIGDRTDPSQLMTGDVAEWENRTALVRVLGPDDGDLVEIIVEGRLQHLVAEKADKLTDSGGEFGLFVGFAHPPGIGVAAPEPGAGAPAETPVPADQPAGPVASFSE
ncbi:hypothetical protein [Nocardia pneumoniae]|uniref:hypothetical protein n=1 Tax=Nocardia pneumoniae TaxID=228601 RepID=UPI0012F69C59|nr:hypothetical protein [Nocardia pneumoniae]